MKKIYLLLLLMCCTSLFAQDWGLIWQDEFDYTGLPDEDKWTYDVGGNGWGNEEAQYYTEARSENAYVEDGNLIITARQEQYEGSDYTSARLLTRGKAAWRYGRIEVRAQLPEGRGVWPAIWMLPEQNNYGNWPASGEIDIMEYVGYNPEEIHFNIHTEAYNHSIGTNKGATTTLERPEDQFYTYAVEWYEDSLKFFVDDELYFTFEKESDDYAVWPFDKPFHAILNIAVGGTWGGAEGIDDSIFPQEMLVDYVRVYTYREHAGPFAISKTTEGGGSVHSETDLSSIEDSTTVTLNAEPDEGYRFVRWSGDVEATSSSVDVLVRNDMQIEAVFVDENELILNGDFEEGMMNWSANTNGNQLTSDGVLCYDVTEPGTNPWDVQAGQGELTLGANEEYLLSFTASSMEERQISVGVGINYDPWTTYINENISLTATEETYTFTFTPEEQEENARVFFDLGGQTGDVCIDNVSLRKSIITSLTSEERKEVGVYPNPAAPGERVIVKGADDATVALYNAGDGRLVEEIALTRNAFSIPSGLPSGIYIVRYVQGGKLKQFKISVVE